MPTTHKDILEIVEILDCAVSMLNDVKREQSDIKREQSALKQEQSRITDGLFKLLEMMQLQYECQKRIVNLVKNQSSDDDNVTPFDN
jgi:hypothetical protein